MIALTEEMKHAIDNALADGNPVVSATVDEDGQPRLAFFGSTQAYSGDQLAIWVRDRSTAFLRRVASNPRITLLYRNPAERQMWQFHGRARVVDEPAVNASVYERSPQPERDRDPDRAGRGRDRRPRSSAPRPSTLHQHLASLDHAREAGQGACKPNSVPPSNRVRRRPSI